MKTRISIRNTILFCSILTIITSCSAQTSTTAIGNHNLISASGDTVSAIDTSIWYVFHDKQGNFWFGSNGQGLYRYDGKIITHFTTRQGLCNNQLRGIQQDSAGNMYFNTVNGISKFDGYTFTALAIINSDASNGGWRLHPADLWFQGAQDSGVIYRYDGTSLYRLKFPKTKAGEDFIAKHPRSQYPQMTFSPYDVYSIYKDSKGCLWFGTNMGVCRYDGSTFAWLSEEELGINDISIHVRATYEDKNGAFWFTNTMHQFHIYPTGNEKAPISYSKEPGIINSKYHDVSYFMSSVLDNNGDLWMVTYSKGVWRYDGKTLTQYLVKDGNKDATLFTIYKDHQGDLWLGTHTAGAYKFNGNLFEKFSPFIH